MTTRPASRTPYESKLRLAEEDSFYAAFGVPRPQDGSQLGAAAHHLADALLAASIAVRSVAVSQPGKHSH